MAKIRKQTYSLDQYLKLMNAETIRTDQECQRLTGKQLHSDELNDMTTEIIYAEKYEIESIIERYCKVSA